MNDPTQLPADPADEAAQLPAPEPLGGTTPRGLPYPSATDPISQGAAAIQALATAVDTALGGIYGYLPRVVAGLVNADGTKSLDVFGNTYTPARTGAAGSGVYTLTWATAFSTFPVVVCTPWDTGSGVVVMQAQATAPTIHGVTTRSGAGNPLDSAFWFVAVGRTGLTLELLAEQLGREEKAIQELLKLGPLE